jgi:predicted Zn finger-like uncharacterized protein
MYTQCPECTTIYRLRAEHIAAGRGRARCGTCGAEFDLLAVLVDELPPEPYTSLKRRTGNAAPPLLDVPAARPQGRQRELFVEFDDSRRARKTEAPTFAKGVAVPAPASWGWHLASGVLLLVLAVQLVWQFRAELLREPRVAEFARAACDRLSCTLPMVEDRARIALMARDVRPHPSEPHALIITATLANQAPFAQTYPVVEITLSNVSEQRIAMRRFRPEEYVGDLATLARGLPAEATATLSLEVEDPGQDAIAFEFRFL